MTDADKPLTPIDLRAARGIANGVAISVVLWSIIGYAAWCVNAASGHPSCL